MNLDEYSDKKDGKGCEGVEMKLRKRYQRVKRTHCCGYSEEGKSHNRGRSTRSLSDRKTYFLFEDPFSLSAGCFLGDRLLFSRI
jgi:hypothetical protein